MSAAISDLISSVPLDLPFYEGLYKHFHANPELSNQEEETAARAASELSKSGADYEIKTGIGGHGLVGILRQGSGPVVLLRADMDALPVQEQTGLPYASTKTMHSTRTNTITPVMHACGHDMHITCLLAAAHILHALRSTWTGTLIILFQPAEERGTGARAMVDDGLYTRHGVPIPDIVLGQHVMALPAGTVGSRPGTIMASCDSLRVTLYGRGGHGSMPHRAVDPVMMAANTAVRLQNIVSRETDPNDMAVLTIGYLHAGDTENVISNHAELGVDVRTIQQATRGRIFASLRRIVHAESLAAGAEREPTIEHTRYFPETHNEPSHAEKLAQGFAQHFGTDRFDKDTPRTNVSEDVSVLASSQARPCVFWFFGGTDPEVWRRKEREGRLVEDVPQNHASTFAPVVQPTLRTGVEALCVAALTFLGRKE